MTILDRIFTFSNGQAITGSAASEFVCDMGAGDPVYGGSAVKWNLKAVAVKDFNAGGKIKCDFQTSADNNTWESLAMGLEVTAPKEGDTLLETALPKTAKRYLRVSYTAAGVTEGAISSFILQG